MFPSRTDTFGLIMLEALASYTVARVQHVDVGLTGSGFQTAEYRVVFFGKPDVGAKLGLTGPEADYSLLGGMAMRW